MSNVSNITDANDARKAGVPLVADGVPMVSSKWKEELSRSESGSVKGTARNFGLILSCAPEWRGVLSHDERTGRTMFTTAPPFGDDTGHVPREVTDSDVTRICEWLEINVGLDVAPNSQKLNGAITVVSERNRTDAVCEYLDELEWDHKPRLASMLHRLFGAQDTPLNGAMGTKWMIGAVMRAQRPGSKVDHMLVLQGRQGAGKSRAVADLAGHDFFGDGLPPLSSKDASDYLRGPWIIEMAELDAMSKAETTAAKAFLTRTHDRYRGAYQRRTQDHPRRCTFIGTTNEAAFLRDSTGNRRFWPVEVGEVDHQAIRDDRDQLWAEAMHRYRAGENCYLDTDDLVDAVQEAQEERYQSDAWEPKVEAYLRSVVRTCSLGDVLGHGLKLSPERWGKPEQMRVSQILQRLGWKRKRVFISTANRPYVYHRPAGTEADESGDELGDQDDTEFVA